MRPWPASRSTGRPSLERLAGEPFDVLVVGGGITGAGVALDAASRGLRMALVERDDFASGTSSKSLEADPRRAALPPAGRGAAGLRGAAERQRLRRNAPHLVEVLPFLIPIFGRDGVVSPEDRPRPGLGDVDVRRHRRRPASASCTSACRQPRPLAHMPTLPADRLASAYLYYDAAADDARLTLTVARTAALRLRRRGRQPLRRSPAFAKDSRRAGRSGRRSRPTGDRIDVRRRRASSTPPACGPTTCAPSTRAPTPTRSARPRACTSPCRGRRCATTIAVVDPGAEGQALLFVVPWGVRADGTSSTPTSAPPTPTTTARSTTRSAPRTTSTTCCGAINCSITTDAIRRATSSAPGPACARWSSRLRPARTADLSRAPQGRGRRRRRGHHHRRQAHDVPADGRRHRRRGRSTARAAACGRSRTKRLALLGADAYEAVTASAGRHPALLHLADRYGGEARRVLGAGRRRPDARRAARARASLPARRGGVRRPPRDGDDRRRRALAAHASTAARPRCVGGGGTRGRRAARRRARLGRGRAGRQVAAYRALVDHERTAAGLPPTPTPSLSTDPRQSRASRPRTRSMVRRREATAGSADATDRDRRRPAPATAHLHGDRVAVPDSVIERLRGACARSPPSRRRSPRRAGTGGRWR